MVANHWNYSEARHESKDHKPEHHRFVIQGPYDRALVYDTEAGRAAGSRRHTRCLQQPKASDWRHQHGTEITGNERRRDDDRQAAHVFAYISDDRQHRQKGQNGGQRRREDGNRQFLGAVDTGLKLRLALAYQPNDVIGNDDGVIDDEAERNDQRRNRELLELDPKRPEPQRSKRASTTAPRPP